MQELSQSNFKMEYRPGKEGGKPDAITRGEGDLPTAGDKRLTRNVRILLPKERYWDIRETEKYQTRYSGNKQISRQGGRGNTKSEEGRQRDPNYPKKPGRRTERYERTSVGAISMEGQLLRVSRKDLDTKRRRDTNSAYRQTPRPPTGRTRRYGKKYRTHQPTILVAKDKRRHQTIHKKLQHMSGNEGGPRCTLRITTVK